MFSNNQSVKPGNVKLGAFGDSLSYSVGYIYGNQLLDVDFDLDYKKFFKGVVNAQDTSLQIMSEEQMDDVLNRFFTSLQTKRSLETEETRLKNQREGQEFMAENAKNPEVKTAPAGIQYRVIKAGNGRKVKAGDVVTAHYTGRFIDGELFQTTYDMQEPMTFEVDKVLPGWSEGLKLMRVGDTFEIVVPDSLAYGDMGYEIIEPGAYLIFEVELIGIKN